MVLCSAGFVPAYTFNASAIIDASSSTEPTEIYILVIHQRCTRWLHFDSRSPFLNGEPPGLDHRHRAHTLRRARLSICRPTQLDSRISYRIGWQPSSSLCGGGQPRDPDQAAKGRALVFAAPGPSGKLLWSDCIERSTAFERYSSIAMPASRAAG